MFKNSPHLANSLLSFRVDERRSEQAKNDRRSRQLTVNL